MSDITSFPCEYVQWRRMKTTGDYEVVLGFPGEGFPLFMQIIGEPPKSGESRWVQIAPLEKPDAP